MGASSDGKQRLHKRRRGAPPHGANARERLQAAYAVAPGFACAAFTLRAMAAAAAAVTR